MLTNQPASFYISNCQLEYLLKLNKFMAFYISHFLDFSTYKSAQGGMNIIFFEKKNKNKKIAFLLSI